MNKRDLVELLGSRLGTTKLAAEEIVDGVLDLIREGVARDQEVTLVGFGSWHFRERSPRTGRNPQTGAILEIPASVTVSFRPARAWRSQLAAKAADSSV
mgnify:CR=1 FL=1